MLTASVRRPSVRPPSCRNRATAGQELGSHRAVPALLPASSSSNWATPKQEGYKSWQSLGGMGAWQALQQNDANMTDQSQWGTQGEEIQKPSKQNRQPTHDRECHQVVDRDETGSKSAHAQSSERTTTGHQRGTPRPAHGQNTPLSGRAEHSQQQQVRQAGKHLKHDCTQPLRGKTQSQLRWRRCKATSSRQIKTQTCTRARHSWGHVTL